MKGSSEQEQVAFINWELNNTEKSTGDRLRTITDPAAAGYLVSRYYERPSDDFDQKATRSPENSKIQVEVVLKGLPEGAKAISKVTGPASSSLRVEQSMNGGL